MAAAALRVGGAARRGGAARPGLRREVRERAGYRRRFRVRGEAAAEGNGVSAGAGGRHRAGVAVPTGLGPLEGGAGAGAEGSAPPPFLGLSGRAAGGLREVRARQRGGSEGPAAAWSVRRAGWPRLLRRGGGDHRMLPPPRCVAGSGAAPVLRPLSLEAM